MRPRSFSDEDLLETANRLFLEFGPSVSTSRIAEALGVSQAALFKRIATKKELMIRALAPRVLPAWFDRLSRGPDERPVGEQLHDIITEMEEFFSRMMPSLMVLRAAGISPNSMLKLFPGEPPPLRARRVLTQFFVELNAQGRTDVASPEVTAAAFMGAIHNYHTLAHMLGDQSAARCENFAEDLVDLFWSGIKPR